MGNKKPTVQLKDPWKKLLEKSLHIKITKSEPINAGMNNQLFKLVDSLGKKYFLKKYFKDKKNRLWREFHAIKVMNENGFTNIPQAYFQNPKHQIALYSFEKGQTRTAKDVNRKEILAMAKFLADLNKINLNKMSVDFPPAVLACLNLKRYIHNIDFRINEFIEYLNDSHSLIKQKLRNINIKKIIEQLKSDALSGLSNSDIDKDLPEYRRQLCPIDYGPHNILVDSKGNICFIDFEYFGVDDPARVITDFILHDRSIAISDQLKHTFKNHYLGLVNASDEIIDHINRVEKLVAIEWLAIYLYSLMPIKIKNRKFSDDSFDENKYINQQLKRFLTRLETFNL